MSDTILYYGKTGSVTWNPPLGQHSDSYIRDKYRYVDQDGRKYRLDNMTSPNPRPNMMYEWKGHASPVNGWRYSRETMARLDAEGRIWYPDAKSKRPQLKRYLDEMTGVLLGDVWTDIDPINSRASERLGYATQKPEKLLERIIAASSNEGDIVLDPFCGCGTTVAVAQRMKRAWIGIDITYLAVDLIRKRLLATYGQQVLSEMIVEGIPRDVASAYALFLRSPFDFERWAVSLVEGTPNEKQVADRGYDGIVRFPTDNRDGVGRVVVSVKGGKHLNPAMVRDLLGTVSAQRAEMGILILLEEPTRGMLEVANHSGTVQFPISGRSYPVLQITTIRELLKGERPRMPAPLLPYIQARRVLDLGDQLTFDT